MSHRSLRSTLVPFASGLAAVIAVFGAAVPALGTASGAVAANAAHGQEWWLASLHVTQAWQTSQGTGITVAVLGTGVAASHPDLTAGVVTGPDYSDSGRKPGGPFWGIEGTAVASVIAGHGHGAGHAAGMMGIAPAAKILSIRVTLEFNDPLNSDQAATRRLPGAIANGITYAVDHGARVIDLPLDPGTLGLTGQGDRAAAGGSSAEQAAVTYALRKNVVLVAPAGDDGQGADIVNYPAAYAGVIAVGAVSRNGHLAPFSSRRSYVSVTAPGANLVAATAPGGYAPISSTSTSSGIVAGVAALILSKYPQLTVTQVNQALIKSTVVRPSATVSATASAATAAQDRAAGPGTGYGTVDATRAVALAADLTSAARPAARPAARAPAKAPPSIASPLRAGASALAGSLVRDVVAGLGVLIVLLIVLLLVMRSRRRRRTAAPEPGRAKPRGMHAHRRPDRDPGPDRAPGLNRAPGPDRALRTDRVPGLDRASGRGRETGPGRAFGPDREAGPGRAFGPDRAFGPGREAAGPRGRPTQAGPAAPAAGGWPAPGSWQGGSVGEIAQPPSLPVRPAMTPAPKAASHRAARGASAARSAGNPAGPPWAPAPEPGRTIGPLPPTASSSFAPETFPGLRVPGDMTALPAATGDPQPSAFDFPPQPSDFPPASGFPPQPSGFGFPPSPPGSDFPPQPPGFDFIASPPAAPPLPAVPGPHGPAAVTQESLDFAAAPVPTDYAAPASPAAGFSVGWDLAATDVFPTVAGPDDDPNADEDDSPGP